MTFYVIVCWQCSELNDRDLPIPFSSAAEREQWMVDHRRGTGHYSYWKRDIEQS